MGQFWPNLSRFKQGWIHIRKIWNCPLWFLGVLKLFAKVLEFLSVTSAKLSITRQKNETAQLRSETVCSSSSLLFAPVDKSNFAHQPLKASFWIWLTWGSRLKSWRCCSQALTCPSGRRESCNTPGKKESIWLQFPECLSLPELKIIIYLHLL